MTARYLTCGLLVAVVLISSAPAFGGEGMVALNSCDASCPDDSTDIYVSCGNGTVTDNRSGLVWLANANCFGQMGWSEAMEAVNGLGDLPAGTCGSMEADACDCGLSDHSAPGEWRLPSLAEWQTMVGIVADVDACEPTILNDVGVSCWDEECFALSQCSFYEVQASLYWSSSSYPPQPGYAWLMNLGSGNADIGEKGYAYYAWPVRGGQ